MKKKNIARLAPLGLVAALALSACSANGGDEAVSTDSKATISYAVWDENQVPALKQNIADFNKEYPNIEVKLDVTPWSQFWTKLQTQASSDTLPDVFWMNGPNFQLYAANDQLEPLTGLIDDKKIDPANYPEALDTLYSYDGTQYGVPKDFDTLGLWYNKSILEQAGVEIPTDAWTWDEIHAASKKISDTLGDQGVYGMTTSLTGGQEGYYNSILQAGGEIISEDGKKSGYDSPEAIEGIQFWTDLIADGSMPTLQQLSDTTANVWFTSGKSGFFYSGTWIVSELSEAENTMDLNVAPLPKGERQATVIHGLANVISSKSKNKAASEAFVTYLASKEAQTTQAEMGAANPAFNGTQTAFVDSVPHFDIQVLLDAQDYAYPYPISKNTAAWTQLETDLLPAAFSGDKPVKDVANELATKMNEALAKE
ncbi:ABC transporter substrate-binding protein [Lysinibacter cavernae]|uniref:Multiple sugar transport system substrate-binding protein n=1 Tax=Lysinibacter cavernae TaxID=1640652 RepID=A0A7X5TUF5_9MICO|nr:sugar ABC transporter substrate-binding protein [Lysinibacter cavernae]NIH54323.1 multiple sugar transport system substrate-binding protein [Lysinibacter cavernae]